jgi:hypothetical protein
VEVVPEAKKPRDVENNKPGRSYPCRWAAPPRMKMHIPLLGGVQVWVESEPEKLTPEG